jgi:Domain of unknown function (DUF4386)
LTGKPNIMEEKITSLKRTARLAGLLYLILGALGYYALMYVPKKIAPKEDAAVTVNNLPGNEFLFRTGIAAHLISVVTFLFLALVLYKLFKQVNIHRARQLVALVAVQVPVIFVLETFHIASLLILKGDIFKTVSPAQLQEWSMLLIKIHGYGIMILEVFWGLWLIPFGQLIYRSVFIPRLLGILLILAGVGYTVDSLTFILFPAFRSFTQTTAFIFSGLGEGSTILWLLIFGVKDHLSITVVSEKETQWKQPTIKLQEQV